MGAKRAVFGTIGGLSLILGSLGMKLTGGDEWLKYSPMFGCRDVAITQNYLSNSIQLNDKVNEINERVGLNKVSDPILGFLNRLGGHYATSETFENYEELIENLSELDPIAFRMNTSNNYYPYLLSEPCRNLKDYNKEVRELQYVVANPKIEVEDLEEVLDRSIKLRSNYEALELTKEDNEVPKYLTLSNGIAGLGLLILAGGYAPSRKRKK